MFRWDFGLLDIGVVGYAMEEGRALHGVIGGLRECRKRKC